MASYDSPAEGSVAPCICLVDVNSLCGEQKAYTFRMADGGGEGSIFVNVNSGRAE